MGPSEDRDRADSEFDRLLRGRRARAQPLGDAEFDGLLAEFKSLGNAAPETEASGAALEPGAPSSAGARATGSARSDAVVALLARARDRLVRTQARAGDRALATAVAETDRAITNLQIALLRARPDRVLAVVAAGQAFAVALPEAARVLDPQAVRCEHRGERAHARYGARELACVRLREWWVREAPATAGQWLLLESDGAQALLEVDAVIGVAQAEIRPLGIALQGTRGLRGVAQTAGAAPALLLDVPGLLDAVGDRKKASC